MAKKICIVCGNEFNAYHPEADIYCGIDCKNKARRVTETADGYWVRTCKYCGGEYRIPMVRSANRSTYCSDKCKNEARKNRVVANSKKGITNLNKAVKATKGMNYGEFYKPEVKVIFPAWVKPTRRGVTNG